MSVFNKETFLEKFDRRFEKIKSQLIPVSNDECLETGEVDFDEPSLAHPISQLCTASQCDSFEYKYWAKQIEELPERKHRKLWEFCYILQAMSLNGVLSPGKKALGFGVGKEPIPSLIASRGCKVVATDLDLDQAKEAGWVETNQHVNSLQQLYRSGICAESLFNELVNFETANMNDISHHLTEFDCVWSSCALEHLGSIEAGLNFILNSLRCLKPGGIAVHTTEFNISSNDETLESGSTVLFRRKDIEDLRDRIILSGSSIDLVNYNPGSMDLDIYIDAPPDRDDKHLKLQISKFVTTSIGFIIKKNG